MYKFSSHFSLLAPTLTLPSVQAPWGRLRQSDISSTLVSVASMENLVWNLAAISGTLTEAEEKLLEEIDVEYFKPFKKRKSKLVANRCPPNRP